ncbi:hypothetical protein F4802DRAFT_563101 [Xylaria palmicola]|nr:hypothetical protein F4802DRAFT_563101 [Xylaria palmicola]
MCRCPILWRSTQAAMVLDSSEGVRMANLPQGISACWADLIPNVYLLRNSRHENADITVDCERYSPITLVRRPTSISILPVLFISRAMREQLPEPTFIAHNTVTTWYLHSFNEEIEACFHLKAGCHGPFRPTSLYRHRMFPSSLSSKLMLTNVSCIQSSHSLGLTTIT